MFLKEAINIRGVKYMEIWKDIYFADKGIIYDYRDLYQVSSER